MLEWKHCSALEQSDDRVGGVWLFKGTRIPVNALFENLESGATIDEFVDWFPGVSKEQVVDVLQFAERSLASA